MIVSNIRFHFPASLLEVHSRIVKAGFQCYAVGGAVRNIVLHQKPKDWDLATDATPRDIMRLFRTVLPTGIKHGTVTILYKGEKFETTTFRVEGTYSDSRHPDRVDYTNDLWEDLKRRDFTINAMAVNPQERKLIDPYGGREDCKKRIIRALGDPAERFREDALRILRAVRFSTQLNFTIEPATLSAMKTLASTLLRVSAERIRDEMEKIMASERPSQGFSCMADTGILSILFPELEACRRIGDNLDVFTHSILTCDATPPTEPVVRWAALLHDIGKPSTVSVGPDGSIRFHGHEQVSACLASAILRRLRFPLAFERRVHHLILHHMFYYEENWTDAAVRRFVRTVGKENIEDLFSLRYADGWGARGEKPDPGPLTAFRKRIARVLAENSPLSLTELSVNGNDLAEKAGIPRGPAMGKVLEFLLESVLEDPALNTPDTLLTLARNFYQTRLDVSG